MGENNQDQEYIKKRTIELYDMLPQDKATRMMQDGYREEVVTDRFGMPKKTILVPNINPDKYPQIKKIRDEIFTLNYSFFRYIASHTFINNSYITYEDKLQSACTHFCHCWWWYRWKGDETHKGYRQDLSFAVFFKPRIGEMMERELNEVKYSIRRSLCMEVGKQIGKHWGQVKYEDLLDPRVHLSPDKMNSLKAMFGSLYPADIEEHEMFLEATPERYSEFDEEPSTKFNSLPELIQYEMIVQESKLSDKQLREMSVLYGIPFADLVKARPKGEKMLYDRLKNSLNSDFT